MPFGNLLEKQWREHYEPTLRDAGFDTAFDWYEESGDGEIEDIENPENTVLAAEDSLETLFRVTAYRDQPFVFLAHNPEIQLNEFTNDDPANHQQEHQKLAEISGVAPEEYGAVTEPNWAEYLQNKAGKGASDDREWSQRLGFLLERLDTYSSSLNLSETPPEFFHPDGTGSVGPFFESFYYTNAFKLPTDTGDGDDALGADVDKEFYKRLLRNELEAISADTVFTFGKTAYDSLKEELSIVDVGYEQPLEEKPDNIGDAHGYVFQWDAADVHILVLYHFTAGSWKDDPYKRRLRHSLQYLRDTGAI